MKRGVREIKNGRKTIIYPHRINVLSITNKFHSSASFSAVACVTATETWDSISFVCSSVSKFSPPSLFPASLARSNLEESESIFIMISLTKSYASLLPRITLKR